MDEKAATTKTAVDELFVVGLWATFERFLRRYLQNKGALLKGIRPANLGEAIYDHFIQEVEYWKPDEILDFLKLNLLQNEIQLAGEAKAIYHYRSWIVHGKSEPLQDKIAPITPQRAYETLDKIIQLLLATPDEAFVPAILEQGKFCPTQPISHVLSDGQAVQLLILTT